MPRLQQEAEHSAGPVSACLPSAQTSHHRVSPAPVPDTKTSTNSPWQLCTPAHALQTVTAANLLLSAEPSYVVQHDVPGTQGIHFSKSCSSSDACHQHAAYMPCASSTAAAHSKVCSASVTLVRFNTDLCVPAVFVAYAHLCWLFLPELLPSRIPAALPGREDPTREIFGMAGVPPGAKPGKPFGDGESHVLLNGTKHSWVLTEGVRTSSSNTNSSNTHPGLDVCLSPLWSTMKLMTLLSQHTACYPDSKPSRPF